ncbi:MAG: serine hydrolase [Odoribacter sp.]|nr:serine hydrolase [Odoribacter sp.]
MDSTDRAFLAEWGTVAFLVIQEDSILYEAYWEDWTPQTLSNIFSATKSIVGILIGIAYDEGYIGSLDDKVGKYLPEFQKGKKSKITIRNLLTMSSGLNWDEAYTALFSKTTQAYYGDDIRKLVMSLEAVEEAGKKYSYKSGDTQLLSFVLEAATGQTISAYAEEKLWKPMQACNDALWNLDKKGGDEKSYCCFNSTARDIARFARLMLHKGNWNGKQLVSEAYLQEAMSPAAYLENEFGDGPLDYYGFQIWIMHYRGMQFPAFRGLGGQYLFAIPQKNAIVVRFGHKRSELYEREKTVDMDGYLDIAFKILAERE